VGRVCVGGNGARTGEAAVGAGADVRIGLGTAVGVPPVSELSGVPADTVGSGLLEVGPGCPSPQPMADNTKVRQIASGPIQVSFNDPSTMDGYPSRIPEDYNLVPVGV
jgi:hypothetical protein